MLVMVSVAGVPSVGEGRDPEALETVPPFSDAPAGPLRMSVKRPGAA